MTEQIDPKEHLKRIFSHLKGVKESSGGWRAICPCCRDTDARHLVISVECKQIFIRCEKCNADGLDIIREFELPPALLILDPELHSLWVTFGTSIPYGM